MGGPAKEHSGCNICLGLEDLDPKNDTSGKQNSELFDVRVDANIVTSFGQNFSEGFERNRYMRLNERSVRMEWKLPKNAEQAERDFGKNRLCLHFHNQSMAPSERIQQSTMASQAMTSQSTTKRKMKKVFWWMMFALCGLFVGCKATWSKQIEAAFCCAQYLPDHDSGPSHCILLDISRPNGGILVEW